MTGHCDREECSIEVRNLYEALKAAQYYVERLERAHRGQVVRDLDEAAVGFQRRALPVIAAFDKEMAW